MRGVDASVYARGLLMLVRFPVVILAPLLMTVGQILLFKLVSLAGGDGPMAGATAGIAGLIAQLMNMFGLGVALIVADEAWRRGRAPFDDAWEESRRKAPEILMAAIGFGFILWVAGQIGGLLGFAGALILEAVALFFFIYTLPAAAIGGIPGGAALQVSLERARRTVPNTILVTVIYVLVYLVLPSVVTTALLDVMLDTSFGGSSVVVSLISALIQAIAAGYVAFVLAKAYDDASYRRAY